LKYNDIEVLIAHI